jgi:hypothetical protein
MQKKAQRWVQADTQPKLTMDHLDMDDTSCEVIKPGISYRRRHASSIYDNT